MALVGCIDAPTDDVGAKVDRTTAISLLGESTTGIFDVVAFDDAKLRIASHLRYEICSAQPCEVTPSGLATPLRPEADGYLVAGAVFADRASLRVDAVYRGSRTWGDGSGDLFFLSMAAGKDRVCAVPLTIDGPRFGEEFTEGAVSVPTWQGGAQLGQASDVLAQGLDISERIEATETAAKRCSDLAYVITNIEGQALLADVLVHGDVLVRATPSIDAQKSPYAHLGMVYVRENAAVAASQAN